MDSYQSTSLWLQTLAPQSGVDPHADEREKLRVAYAGFREHAAELAAEIGRDCPGLTVHDGTHLDALWEVGSTIAGESYDFNPAEAFVLGGAILLHDLGLAVAAYPEGPASLEEGPEWLDAVAIVLRKSLGRAPKADEIASVDSAVEAEAMGLLLRKKHAERAEALGLVCWRSSIRNCDVYLLEDSSLRSAFGRTIGRVARSHWSSLSEVAEELSTTLAPPPSLPAEWTVDQLKVACLLRTADAAHLDLRRAPALLHAARRISGESNLHWTAQGKLHRPIAAGDRLEYSSGDAFTQDEAAAWWLSADLLKLADRELRETDALLDDTSRARFSVGGVRAIDSPERLAQYIRTDGWIPIDAQVHITDVNRLVEKLGGSQLYGENQAVGLRELLQNGIDATQARTLLDGSPGYTPQVIVELGSEGDSHWIEVRDNGVGMSASTLTQQLLDFGKSLWSSADIAEVFPGLAGQGFQAVGKFGIGFFAVFMLGKEVRVTSRRYDLGRDETYVLQFPSGVSERPLLRRASQAEKLSDGGTTVRIHLNQEPALPDGLLGSLRWRLDDEPLPTLGQLCAYLAPGSPIDIRAIQDGVDSQVVDGGDWVELDPMELCRRLAALEKRVKDKDLQDLAERMRPLTVADGTTVGRAAVIRWRQIDEIGEGAVIVGGLRASDLGALHGLLVGDVKDAARQVALPVVPPDVLASWASEQAELLVQTGDEQEQSKRFDEALVITRCGGDSGPLPICASADGVMTFRETAEWLRGRNRFRVVHPFDLVSSGSDHTIVEEDVLVIEPGGRAIVSNHYPYRAAWPEGIEEEIHASEAHRAAGLMVGRACCEAWGCAGSDVSVEVKKEEFAKFRDGPLVQRIYIISRPGT